MVQIGLVTKAEAPVKAATRTRSRLFFIDHLRAALVILVVLHHLALVYGGIPPFYYFEPPYTDPLAGLMALVFVLFNQAWFMGAFFLLAGYFTPGSFDRKGSGRFLKDRLIRLGIPLVVYTFLLNPIASLGFYLMPSSLTGITDPPTWQAYPRLIGIGPLWFVAMLLIFSLAYAAWRRLTANRLSNSMSSAPLPGYLRIGLFILILALASYLMRLIVPLGKSVNLFADFLGFPTLSYLPQYLSFFVLGTIAARHDWFRALPGTLGFVGFVTAAAAGVILFPLALSGHWFSLDITEASVANAFGYGHWQSAVYALWDSMFAVGMVLGLIPLFRHFLNAQGSVGSFLAQHSYAVYIIHIPIVVLVAYALRGLVLASLLKFALVALIVVPACFVVAYLIRKLPYASKVI